MTHKIIIFLLDLRLWGEERAAAWRGSASASIEERLGIQPTLTYSEPRMHALSGWIRARLRSHPYWSNGHLTLATLALELRDSNLAYASCLAAIKLSDGGAIGRQAQLLLGRTFLQNGSLDRAEKTLNDLLATSNGDPQVLEELVAVCLARERYSDARQFLEKIPSSARSAGASSALLWLNDREQRIASGEAAFKELP